MTPLRHGVAAAKIVEQSRAQGMRRVRAQPISIISHGGLRPSGMASCSSAARATLPRAPPRNRIPVSVRRGENPRRLSAAAPSISTAEARSGTPEPSSSKNEGSRKSSDGGDGASNKKDDSNLFLDNLGKIFLSTIGLVLVMLLRSTRSNNSRTALRDDVESSALLDPLEIDDLRTANSDFTVEVWERVSEAARREFAGREGATYPEFLTTTVRAMEDARGEGFTIQLGHLLDRVVIAELERRAREREGGEGSAALPHEGELPLTFLLAALSLALNGSVADRVRVLYESMSSADGGASAVPGERASEMIQHLQSTCQLASDAQIVETDSRVPYQTYRVGTGEELTRRAREGHGGKKGSAGVTREAGGPVSLEDFRAILKSRAVCAWGECYVKKAGRTATSDR